MTEMVFKLEITTPEGVFYAGDAAMLELNTTEGRLGILPGHIPLTVILKPGIVTLYEPGGEEKKARIQAGFAAILQDKVTILAEMAEWNKQES